MKKILSLIFIGLLLAGGSDAMAQNKKKKSSNKKQSSMYVEGRQKVRQSDYASFDKFTNFSSKDNNVYYSTFNYTDIPGLTVDPNPSWPDEIRPVMNYMEKVSRATMTLCAIYAINPEIIDHVQREQLHKQAREEAMAALDAFDDWKA